MVIACVYFLVHVCSTYVQQLTDSCADHVEHIIKESTLDYIQDVRLARACRDEVTPQ